MPKKRFPQCVTKVVPQLKYPIKLRNNIAKGGESQRLAGICISEISELFVCFKNHNFSQEACAKEILSFKKCYDAHENAFKSSRDSSSIKLSTKTVHELLKKY